MKKIQIITLTSLTLLTLLGYVYIFGDSGFIIQTRLKKNLANMEAQIQDLEKENKVLNQKILSHTGDSGEALKDENNDQMARSIILKFENNLDETSGEELKSDMEPDLLELRSLYIVTMLFITLVAVTFSFYLSGEKQTAIGIGEQE